MPALAMQSLPNTSPTYRVWTEHPTLVRAAKAARDYLTLRLAGDDAVSAEASILAAFGGGQAAMTADAETYRLARQLIREAEQLLGANLRVDGE